MGEPGSAVAMALSINFWARSRGENERRGVACCILRARTRPAPDFAGDFIAFFVVGRLPASGRFSAVVVRFAIPLILWMKVFE